MTQSTQTDIYPKSESWKIFDAIYKHYDLANSILSFGLHQGWRQKIVQKLPVGKNLKVLDLATGTADVLITLVQKSTSISAAYGIDLSENMLTIGREKIEKQNLQDKATLQKGDANQLNFLNNEFDFVTISFGIRNVQNPINVLKEMYRVTKIGGKAVILEFSLPKNIITKFLYLIYLKLVVPVVGGIISGNFKAYFYLNRTIEKFPYGETFQRMMHQCGFQKISAEPLLLGIATLYTGDKT